jgi:hypothetical protein
MTLIETEEAAKRLARVILSDIELYNQPKIQARADLRRELAEGLSLFRSRVVPTLVPLFSQVASTRPWGHGVPLVVMSPPSDQLRVDTAAFEPTHAASHEPRGHRQEMNETARRLARTMVSGIEVADRPDGGAGIPAAIEEARQLFQSCVLPDLMPLFDEALAERGLLAEEEPPTFRRAPAPPRALDWRQISKLQIAGLVASIAVAAAVIAYCSLTAF